MSVDLVELKSMASVVARAIHEAARDDPEETWEDLEAEEQAQFLVIAHAAMAAHDAWLTVSGYCVVKFKTKAQKAKERRKLITPTQGLVRPN